MKRVWALRRFKRIPSQRFSHLHHHPLHFVLSSTPHLRWKIAEGFVTSEHTVCLRGVLGQAEATSAKGKKKIKGTKLVLTQVCLAPFQAFAELTLHGAIVRHVDEICSLFSLRQLSNFER